MMEKEYRFNPTVSSFAVQAHDVLGIPKLGTFFGHSIDSIMTRSERTEIFLNWWLTYSKQIFKRNYLQFEICLRAKDSYERNSHVKICFGLYHWNFGIIMFQMQKGSIILAMIGTVFTLVGVCVDQWLVYDPIESGKGLALLHKDFN